MRLHENTVPQAFVTPRKGRRRKIVLTSIDVALSTREITGLIGELEELKREGRKPRGFHVHLMDDDVTGRCQFQVTLFHEKSFSPHQYSARIEL